MTERPSAIKVFDSFYALCMDAYVCWRIGKVLFDENTKKNDWIGGASFCLWHINLYIHEMVRLKISKLHDRAKPKPGNNNLSIGYVVQFNEWSDETKEHLRTLVERLSKMKEQLGNARNKRIAHNDVDVILNEEEVGGFNTGDDDEYFRDLQTLINVMSKELTGKARQFDTAIEKQAEEFRRVLLRGWFEQK